VPMTYEEWLDWVPDGNLGEWVDGKGIIFVSASDEHQWTALLLYQLIARFASLYGLGRAMAAPFHIRLWEGGPAREPDVLFVAMAHLDRWTSTRILGAVDFAAEVLSPDSITRDLVDKLRDYALAGIFEYLLIDPRPGQRWMRLYRLDEGGTYREVESDGLGRIHFEVLPGFWLDPRWFQQRPLPEAEELLLEIAGDAYRDWFLAKMLARDER
jgi:Uma2 family endonuclease